MAKKKEETKITKSEPAEINSPVLSDLAAGNPHPLFLANYGERLKSIAKPSHETLLDIVNILPDDLKEPVTALLKQMSPNRPGLYLSDERPVFTELRLFHGTGDDKKRPENTVPGQFYLTTKTNVGQEFIGTVIALWQGRTMWPPQGDDARAPVCTSMDRRVGSKYGDCTSCPHRPWRDGKRQDCGNDVVVFMLPKDLSDIIMVRFQRTSARAGEQLATLAKKDLVPWQRWFKLSTEKQVRGDNRWYVINVDPLTDETVPTKLASFCAALEQMASHDFIVPGIAQIYRTAHESADGSQGDPDPESDGDTAPDDDGYGDIQM